MLNPNMAMKIWIWKKIKIFEKYDLLSALDKPRVNHLTHLSHYVSLHGQKDSFSHIFWVILSVYWPTMSQMSQMIHLGFSVWGGLMGRGTGGGDEMNIIFIRDAHWHQYMEDSLRSDDRYCCSNYFKGQLQRNSVVV